MFNNKKFEGIHYSRFIASWTNVNGAIGPEFRDWMGKITVNGRKIPDNIIEEIYDMGTCGMFELEVSAAAFIVPIKNQTDGNVNTKEQG